MFEWIASIGHWAWLSAGLVLVFIELLAPGAFFLWLGISAGVVGIITWIFLDMGWEYEFAIFAVLSVGSVLAARIYLRRNPIQTDEPLLNRRGSQYVGRRFTLGEPIEHGRGKIHVDDTMWKIEGEDMPAGASVEVTGLEGVVLRVAPVGDGAPAAAEPKPEEDRQAEGGQE